MKKTLTIFALMLAATQVSAEGIDVNKIYFGGGLSSNDIGYGDSAIGFQVFAGMPLPIKTQNVKISAEAGYMDSGDFDKNLGIFGTVSNSVNGLWGTVVADLPLNQNVSAIGRLGLDIGDDDGVMIGFGLGFPMSHKTDLRVEYVIRDHVDSFQLNLVLRQ